MINAYPYFQLSLIANIKLLLMSTKKHHQYYNTPLNLSQTIDLPSNLLQGKPSLRSSIKSTSLYQPNTPHQPQYQTLNQLSNTTHAQLINPRHRMQPKKSENVMLIEEKSKQRRNVLYKRLSDIKGQNKQLQKYSYSKLLSKMVVSDPNEQYRSVNFDQDNIGTISQYSCLRGKLLNMDQMDEAIIQVNDNKARSGSSYTNYNSRTTRIFKRYYMPSGQKARPSFFNQPTEQKYIYINGKKTECKRIHNFYTSQNFRQSYDKAFGKTKDSFYSSAGRYDKDL